MTQLSLSATQRALVASSLASDVMLGLTDVLSHKSKLATFRHHIAEIGENLGETFLDHCTSSWCFKMHLPESPAQLAPLSLCDRGHLVLLFNKLPFKSFNLAANEVHSCSLASLGFPFHPVILTQSEDGSLGWKTTAIRKFRYKFRAFPFVKLIFRKNNRQSCEKLMRVTHRPCADAFPRPKLGQRTAAPMNNIEQPRKKCKH